MTSSPRRATRRLPMITMQRVVLCVCSMVILPQLCWMADAFSFRATMAAARHSSIPVSSSNLHSQQRIARHHSQSRTVAFQLQDGIDENRKGGIDTALDRFRSKSGRRMTSPLKMTAQHEVEPRAGRDSSSSNRWNSYDNGQSNNVSNNRGNNRGNSRGNGNRKHGNYKENDGRRQGRPNTTDTRGNRQPRQYKQKPFVKRRKRLRGEEVRSSDRWYDATQTEELLRRAMHRLQTEPHHLAPTQITAHQTKPLSFPPIRKCNAAMATFGDGGDLLRSLRMFVRMRKAGMMVQRAYKGGYVPFTVPSPTLVTFSTLMSRAVQHGKPRVALRLWNLMRTQKEFFSSSQPPSSMDAASTSSLAAAATARAQPKASVSISAAATAAAETDTIVPDVKAANILMNCYAKLGDLDSAMDLMDQMESGDGVDVPKMETNLVTYNTLLDACQKAGNLDAAMDVHTTLLQNRNRRLWPDTRSYTTLIATVARRANAISGVNDPTVAFTLLEEMQRRNIRPNGMTYSALIDVCGRCSRSDLALKGLRMMMDQKAQDPKGTILPNEVGAWTAAINACGKAGRLDTAIKLFYSMPNYGVYPNTITCGCLTDCLLKDGRLSETIDVLRYMKKYRIAPSEVMYTSLMTSASRLVKSESTNTAQQPTIVSDPNPSIVLPPLPVNISSNGNGNNNGSNSSGATKMDETGAESGDATKAIEVYTELIVSLSQQQHKDKRRRYDDEVMQAFLVFQEMKTVGAQPDLACYNALLRSCANAGDVGRAQEVLQEIQQCVTMEPNDVSYREVIRAAGKSRRSDVAISTWQMAIQQQEQTRWRPTVDSLSALVIAILRSASSGVDDDHTRQGLYKLVGSMYKAILKGTSPHSMGMHLISDPQLVFADQRLMSSFLQAVTSLDAMQPQSNEKLRALGISIVTLPCFQDGLTPPLLKNPSYRSAHQTAQKWLSDGEGQAAV